MLTPSPPTLPLHSLTVQVVDIVYNGKLQEVSHYDKKGLMVYLKEYLAATLALVDEAEQADFKVRGREREGKRGGAACGIASCQPCFCRAGLEGGQAAGLNGPYSPLETRPHAPKLRGGVEGGGPRLAALREM